MVHRMDPLLYGTPYGPASLWYTVWAHFRQFYSTNYALYTILNYYNVL